MKLHTTISLFFFLTAYHYFTWWLLHATNARFPSEGSSMPSSYLYRDRIHVKGTWWVKIGTTKGRNDLNIFFSCFQLALLACYLYIGLQNSLPTYVIRNQKVLLRHLCCTKKSPTIACFHKKNSYCEVFLDGREGATDVSAHVWECRTSWQGFHLAFTVNTYRVLEEVASHLSHLIGKELIPVMLPELTNPPHAL